MKKKVKSVGAFLADSSERQKEELEAKDAHFSHWGEAQHIGLTITARVACGELHVQGDGTVTFHIERSLGELIKSARVRVSDERGFKEQYEVFRSAVLNAA
jgi:hypothetical protein